MNKLLGTGEIVKTTTNRDCTPFPKVDCTTDRKCINTIKRVDAWLKENAILEAQSQKNEFTEHQFKIVNKCSQADRDFMNAFLFGY